MSDASNSLSGSFLSINARKAKAAVSFFVLIFACTVMFPHKRVSGHFVEDHHALYGPSSNPVSCPGCNEQSDQGIYIPLTFLPESGGSEIVFNSRTPEVVPVTPLFYTQSGEVVTGNPVNINPLEIRYVDLKSLIPVDQRGRSDWGGLSLKYFGGVRKMWAQLRFLAVNGGNNVDEFFIVESEQRSDTQAATWWSPPGGSATIGLGNVTDGYTSATITFGNGENQNVTLAPHATTIIRHSQTSAIKSSESALIEITGPAGSIVPTGLLETENHNSNSVIRFYDTKFAKQPNLYGNGISLKNATPHMVLYNTSSGPLTAVPKFIPEAGTASNPVQLAPLNLGPNESVEVDLGLLSDQIRARRDLDTASAVVDSTGGPGDLIGSFYTSERGTGFSYDVPLRDSGPVRTMTGSYPWKSDDEYSTIVYITNITDQSQEFVAQVNFEGGTFGLKPRRLAPGETAEIDLKKLRDDQKADDVGRVIPQNIKQGQFRWAHHGVTGGKLALIGRAVMVSKSNRIMTSYSCNDPCPPRYSGYIVVNFQKLSIGDSGTVTAWEVAYYDQGYSYPYSFGPYQVGADWTMDRYDYCSMGSNSASQQTFTGISPGLTYISAFMGTFESYYWDGLNCYDANSTYDLVDGGPIETVCYIPINFRQVGQGTDVGNGTLHFEYAWDSSSGNLSDLSSCTVGEVVTYPGYPGTNIYTPPSPPFNQSFQTTVINDPASDGAFLDNHRTSGGFVTPYAEASFTAIQYYRYSCPCKDGGAYVNLMGPINIVRSVSRIPNTNQFKFTITKSGYSATINPLP